MRNLQEVYKARLKHLQHFFQIYFTSVNAALKLREGLKILRIQWSIHTTAVTDCKNAACTMQTPWEGQHQPGRSHGLGWVATLQQVEKGSKEGK